MNEQNERRALGWHRARRLLAVRLDAMGDVLMTSPALAALKGPGRTVSVLTSPAGAAAAALIPDVDEVVVYEAPWMKHTPPRDAAPDRAMIERLRSSGYDAAAIFTVYSQNPQPAALLTYLAGIPLRLAHSRENPYQLLTDWVPDPDPGPDPALARHEVRRQLDLVASVGFRPAASEASLRVAIPSSARSEVDTLLGDLGINDGPGPLVVIHPGASAPSRRYPAEGFAGAAQRLAQDGCRIVVTGSPAEADLAESVRGAAGGRAWSLAGCLGLPQLGAVLARADLLVANNTGPVHLAAAVGTPVVDLYAQTNPQHTPWAVPHRTLFHDVECRWCYRSVCPQGHHHCLRLVQPEEIVIAARELLAALEKGSDTRWTSPPPLPATSTPSRTGTSPASLTR